MNWTIFIIFVIGFAIGYFFDFVVGFKQRNLTKMMQTFNKTEIK